MRIFDKIKFSKKLQVECPRAIAYKDLIGSDVMGAKGAAPMSLPPHPAPLPRKERGGEGAHTRESDSKNRLKSGTASPRLMVVVLPMCNITQGGTPSPRRGEGWGEGE